jgi:dTDP-4-dehydrorhamnose reductase
MILVTGSNGQVGTELCRLFDKKGVPYISTDVDNMDITKKRGNIEIYSR